MPKLLGPAILSIFLIGIGGCKTAPERRVDDAGARIPSHWSATGESGQPPPEHWVEAFGNPDLSALVHSALADNYDLKAAAARVDAAIAQARIDGSALWPQIFFMPSYQNVQFREAGFGPVALSAFQAMFSLNWELDVWGRIRDLKQAAVREAGAEAADFHAARLSLAARIAQSYFELTEAKLQSEVAAQSVKDRSTIADLVRGRFARGITNALDLRLTLTDLATAEAELSEARNQTQIVTRRLEVLLGRYPQGLLTEASVPSALPEPPADIPAGLPSELLERRPDLIAAFNRLLAADSRVESVRKLLLPRIVLTAFGGTRSTALTDLIDPRALAWNMVIGLLQPLFTGGLITGQIHLNKARMEE
ncbi:MAG: efflux transporter outer membrane subunit, partial [Nitrosospira sp.]|nr:efflux transporter outer membrane subunit [Nitrosospira sp.]